MEDFFKGKRILVTGGLGFVGSNLARRLVQLGAEVVIVDSNNVDTGANLYNIEDMQQHLSMINIDVRETKKLRPCVKEADIVFNLAGMSSHVGGMQNPVEDLEVNALAQLKLLELCREVNGNVRIVLAGTRQVYGSVNKLPVDELAMPSPVDYNGVSKLAGEFYHQVAHRVYGLWTTSLRMTNTYGPRMRVKDARQMFIGHWIQLLLDGENIPIYGDGLQVRDLNHVDDVIDAMLLCVINPAARGKIYNLGGEQTNLLDLARTLIKLNGSGSYTLTPFPPERSRIDLKNYVGNYSKIQSEIGWEPQISLKVGLAQTLAFYRSNLDKYR
jgi:UDP-glucose 4-epimerase